MHRDRLDIMKKRIDNTEPVTTALNPGKNNVKKAQQDLERQGEVDLVRHMHRRSPDVFLVQMFHAAPCVSAYPIGTHVITTYLCQACGSGRP